MLCRVGNTNIERVSRVLAASMSNIKLTPGFNNLHFSPYHTKSSDNLWVENRRYSRPMKAESLKDGRQQDRQSMMSRGNSRWYFGLRQ